MAGLLPFLSRKHLNILFVVGASLVAIGLPYSIALMSIGTIWISAVYILEGGYKEKLRGVKSTPVLFVIGLFVLHVIWLLFTEDFSQGVKEIRKIIPLISIPIVFSGIQTLTESQRRGLIWVFALATASSIFFIYVRGYLNGTLGMVDPRELSIFTSHIRLSLFICFSVVWISFSKISWWLKLALALFLLSFIVVVQSLTGVIILLALLLALLGGVLEVKQVSAYKWIRYITLTALTVVVSFVLYTLMDYYDVKNEQNTPLITAEGNKYNKELENGFIENGSYLWSYVSYSELEVGFKKVTDKSIWEKDKNGFTYYGTLIRYLNNKGLTKDAAGLRSLMEEDYLRILRGNPYPDSWKHKGFSKRLRGFLFQLEKGRYTPDFSGNSLTEKIVFQTAGWNAYMKSPVLGSGTGDLKLELGKYYETVYPDLPENQRRKPHNQYLTYLIMFGPLGLVMFIGLFISLLSSSPKPYKNICWAFSIIVLLSCLGEDTAASQAGLTFIGFFIGVLFLVKPRE